ncbi:head completion/stabilization protein (plasmid) [Halodesulfovibrio aestuarii]|uniref:Phage head completion protein (GPL) n=1 Tax=Halodesulfovibrio aestuarii TaxID=126333 RepID=A0A8G2CC46_9BACT|nr:head completion/stabilization protein [Halodesulfovibrio aestuarii]SHJ71972.1 Phage head completion protein (GPL) [Halodesulfovibrio aestuarii]
MSSFSGHTAELATVTVTNEPFWPDLSLAEFQKIYRLPREYTDELLINQLKLGMAWANKQLIDWKNEQIAAGYSSLASVPEDIQGCALGGETPAVLHYKRAVSNYAKAYLLQHYATINRREAAHNEAKESTETRDTLLTNAEDAISDFLGNNRVDVELI